MQWPLSPDRRQEVECFVAELTLSSLSDMDMLQFDRHKLSSSEFMKHDASNETYSGMYFTASLSAAKVA